LHVLEDHERGRSALEVPGKSRGDLVRARNSLREPGKLTAVGCGDVRERPKRARREQRIASAPDEPSARMAVDERPDQGGLAHAGLAADQDEAPAAGAACTCQLGIEQIELRIAFEELATAAG